MNTIFIHSQDSPSLMENEDDDLCVDEDEEDQCARSTKTVQLDITGKDNIHNICAEKDNGVTKVVPQGDIHQLANIDNGSKKSDSISYKSMLLGVNGAENDDNSEDLEAWSSEEDSEDNMHEDNNAETDPLCPDVPISAQERKNLCWP